MPWPPRKKTGPSIYDSKTDGKTNSFGPCDTKLHDSQPGTAKRDYCGNPVGSSVNRTSNYDKDFFTQTPEEAASPGVRAGWEDYTRYIKKSPGVLQGENALPGEFHTKDPYNAATSLEGERKVERGDSLEGRLIKKYHGRETPGKALFYQNSDYGLPLFHLAVDELGWEFLYGGNPTCQERGLSGKLFYNEGLLDRAVSRPGSADFSVEQKEENKKYYVLIKFYIPGTEKEHLFGEFLAADPDNKCESLLDQHRKGQWQPLGPDLEKDLRKKYDNERVSDALFYRDREDPSLKSFRLEAYQLGWELSDGTSFIGQRLGGTLFFNDAFFREDPGPFKATYYIERKKGKRGNYALVKFFAPGTSRELWGEFLASDPGNTAGESGLLGEVLRGEWQRVDYTVLSATVIKNSHSTKITLSTLGYVAEIDCKREGEIVGDAFRVQGVLITKTLREDGQYGRFVRWYRDRAVFYENQNAKDFTAFFFPSDERKTQGSKDDLKLAVTWKPKGYATM